MRGLILLLLLSASTAWTQSPGPATVEDSLRSSQGGELKKTLSRIGVPGDLAEYYSASGVFGFKLLYLKSTQGTSLNVLYLPCSPVYGAQVLLLERSKDGWNLRDQTDLDCHYNDAATVELARLTSNRQYDVLVHHDCDGRGTGYIEQHTRVLRIAGGRFHQVLDEADTIHAFPNGQNGRGSFEESAFLPTTAGTLEQTRTTAKYDKNDQPILDTAIVSRRTFHWDGKTFIKTSWRRLR